jgi:uncharacterized membrane protein
VHWILIALSSAAVSAFVSISDKTVIYRYAHSSLTLPLLIGLSHTIVGMIVIASVGIPDPLPASAIAAAILSGILFGFSGFISQRVLFTQEVSRTVPITQSAPIFTAILAIPLLGESISAVQWAGIITTVIGSATLSLRVTPGVSRLFLHQSFYLLMFSSLFLGCSNVIAKIALNQLPVLFTHGIRELALAQTLLALTFRKIPWNEVRGYFRRRSPALIFVGINEFFTANLGLILFLLALSKGPAALVLGLIGTRAMFVVLYSTVLALVWRGALGEEISFVTVCAKGLSVVLIVFGVIAIAL